MDRALVRLVIMFVAVLVINAAFTVAVVASTQHQLDVQHNAIHLQHEQSGKRICATLKSLYALIPPAGNPVDNPSRSYLQGLHAKFGELHADLGCKLCRMSTPREGRLICSAPMSKTPGTWSKPSSPATLTSLSSAAS